MDLNRQSQELRADAPRRSIARPPHAARETAIPVALSSEPHAETRRPSEAYQFRPRAEAACRVMNVLIAGTAIAALSPVMALTALIVKATSPGPIFYTQTRVGVDRRRPRRGDATTLYDRRTRDLGGRPFTIYKFRSMRVDAERTGAVWATKRDSRVTTFGRIMRKTRLDELPQLFNVLLGDMNIVGPRPERPTIFADLRRSINEYPLRQRAKPGITGWAQINHAYDTCLEDVRVKVRYDLEYLQRQGVAEDMKIMLATVPVMVFRKGGW